MKVYLDNAATTKIDSRVLQKMLPFLKETYGNASSIHEQGQIARRAIEESRNIIAKKIDALPEEIIFTSGATESNNLVILGVAKCLKKKGNHIITSQIEHSSVLNACKNLALKGFQITYLPVTKEGVVKPELVERAITKKTILVSIMHANNETGTIQNINSFADICARKGILFHTDCVQSFLKVPFSLKKISADFVSLSAHKIHGPKGTGALFVRKNITLSPLFFGGNQENKLRPGTENVSGIVGFAKASLLLKKTNCNKMKFLQNRCVRELLRIPKITIHNLNSKKVCNIINFSIENVSSEDLLKYLNCRKIYVSSASACSSHEKSSHVLEAMGLSKIESENSIRISLSKFTTTREISFFLRELKKICIAIQKCS